MPYVAKQRLMTVVDIRRALNALYPNVDDDEFSIQVSGFVHEHPMTAIGVVLISSIVLGTTDIAQLATFTSYSKRFVHAIAANLSINSWRNCGVDMINRKLITMTF